MKKALIAGFVILLSFSAAGCGVQKKIGEKIGEKVIEQIAGNEGVDMDINNGVVTFKGEDGEVITYGAADWPDVDYLPEFKKGDIVSCSSDDKGNVYIVFENVDKKDYESYIDTLKAEFTVDASEMSSPEYLFFEAANSQGNTVVVQYFADGKSLVIGGQKESE